MELTIEQALQEGVNAHKQGKHQMAVHIYRAILQSQPQHPDANHNLGLLAVYMNKADEALPLFKTAIKSKPKTEQFVIPEEGKFLIFPSWLKHSVGPFYGEGERRTLSANFRVPFGSNET